MQPGAPASRNRASAASSSTHPMTLNYYAHATFHSAQEEMERLQAKAKTTAEAKPEPAAESAEENKAA